MQQIADRLNGQTRCLHQFSDLMQLYEANYIRLIKLIPEFASCEDQTCSVVQDCLALHLRVLERCRYTTTLVLTYQFDEQTRCLSLPDLHIRAYHDARQAEVLRCCGGSENQAQYLYDAQCEKQIEKRWRLNRFLYKWLTYCLRRGHGFPREEKLLDYQTEILGFLGSGQAG